VRDVIVAMARRQHGLVTLDQLRAAGHSRSWWHRAHRDGLLVPVHRGVSRVAVVTPSPWQTILAAVLLTGGAASHLSAAWLWGADVPGTDPVDVTVTDRRRSARAAGVRVHRPTDLADLLAVDRGGVPTTSPLRTALDVGAVAGPDVVGAVVECFLGQRFVSLAQLRAAVEHHGRRGRSGLGALRRVLAGPAPAAQVCATRSRVGRR
jgi:hypothetical protein